MSYLVLVNAATNLPPGKMADQMPRSFFSSEQRYSQTLDTLRSIVETIPDPVIILAEATTLTEEQKKGYSCYAHLLDLSNCSEVVQAVAGTNKSLGEVTTLRHALLFIEKELASKVFDFDMMIKICARNRFSPDFDLRRFDDPGKYYFRIFSNSAGREWYATSMYAVGKARFSHFQKVLDQAIQSISSGHVLDIETNLRKIIPREFVEASETTLG